MITIPIKWLFHWGYTPFSDIPILKSPNAGRISLRSLDGSKQLKTSCVTIETMDFSKNKNQTRHQRKQFNNHIRDSRYVGNHNLVDILENDINHGHSWTFFWGDYYGLYKLDIASFQDSSPGPQFASPGMVRPTIIQATLQDGHEIYEDLATMRRCDAWDRWICIY